MGRGGCVVYVDVHGEGVMLCCGWLQHIATEDGRYGLSWVFYIPTN